MTFYTGRLFINYPQKWNIIILTEKYKVNIWKFIQNFNHQYAQNDWESVVSLTHAFTVSDMPQCCQDPSPLVRSFPSYLYIKAKFVSYLSRCYILFHSVADKYQHCQYFKSELFPAWSWQWSHTGRSNSTEIPTDAKNEASTVPSLFIHSCWPGEWLS